MRSITASAWTPEPRRWCHLLGILGAEDGRPGVVAPLKDLKEHPVRLLQ